MLFSCVICVTVLSESDYIASCQQITSLEVLMDPNYGKLWYTEKQDVAYRE